MADIVAGRQQAGVRNGFAGRRRLDTLGRHEHGGGETAYLADFAPTQQQLTTFMFFDQYAQSHSPWSLNSRYLVFSGVLGFQLVRTPLPSGPETSI